jgi:probable F420-dependent oxidoreductase
MKLGAVFPQTEIGPDPESVRRYVEAVEARGFDYLLVYDHVLGVEPDRYNARGWSYTGEDQFHEPMVLFGYLAAITQRLELVTGILVLTQRNTPLVAKQAAEVDRLSGGRLRLGVGVGWNVEEIRAMGYDPRNRGRRLDEQVRLLRALWSEPYVDFEGEYHTIRGLGINPLPRERHIPLWFGGTADPVLRRMAEHGDGWIAQSVSPERGRPMVDALHRYLEEQRRDPASFGIDARVSIQQQPPETWPEYIGGWRELGATHFCCNTMKMGFRSIEEHLAALDEFKAFMSQA